MEGQLSYSNALLDVAKTCIALRAKHECKCEFNTAPCSSCDVYIKNYVQTDENSIKLFMFEAQKSYVADHVASTAHRPIFAGLAACFLLLAGLSQWHFSNKEKNHIPWENEVAVVVPDVKPAAKTTKSSWTSSDIWTVLKQIDIDLRNYVDVNGDGKSSCLDASVLFYKYYSSKNDVHIINNKKMNHAFVTVRVNGQWITVEPQAVYVGHNTYDMRKIWGKQYDQTGNVDETEIWKRYAK